MRKPTVVLLVLVLAWLSAGRKHPARPRPKVWAQVWTARLMQDGRPIRGAHVRGFYGGVPRSDSITDEAGRFRIASLMDTYRVDWRDATPSPRPSRRPSPRPSRRPSPWHIDPDTLRSAAQTDGEIEVPTGPTAPEVLTSQNDSERGTRELPSSQPEEIPITIHTEQPDHLPLFVFATSRALSVTSLGDGVYVVGLREGPCRLRIEAPNLATSEVRELHPLRGQPQEIWLPLSPFATQHLQIVGAGGEPVAGAHVQIPLVSVLDDPTHVEFSHPQTYRVADARGRIEVPRRSDWPPEAQVNVSISTENYLPYYGSLPPLDVGTHAGSPAQIRLPEQTELTAHLREGNPWSSMVSVWPHDDPDRHYDLRVDPKTRTARGPVPVGDLRVAGYVPYAAVSKALELVTTADKPAVITLDAPPAVQIYGTLPVVRTNGSADWTSLMVWPRGKRRPLLVAGSQRLRTLHEDGGDVDGDRGRERRSFAFDVVDFDQALWIQAVRKNGHPTPIHEVHLSPDMIRHRIDFTFGQRIVRGQLDLTTLSAAELALVAKAPEALRVQILDTRLAEFDVHSFRWVSMARGAVSPLSERVSATPDADGNFVLEGVAPGAWTLIVSLEQEAHRVEVIATHDFSVEASSAHETRLGTVRHKGR